MNVKQEKGKQTLTLILLEWVLLVEEPVIYTKDFE